MSVQIGKHSDQWDQSSCCNIQPEDCMQKRKTCWESLKQQVSDYLFTMLETNETNCLLPTHLISAKPGR